jgi:hypothetical protein
MNDSPARKPLRLRPANLSSPRSLPPQRSPVLTLIFVLLSVSASLR